jgi:hypothetical protein
MTATRRTLLSKGTELVILDAANKRIPLRSRKREGIKSRVLAVPDRNYVTLEGDFYTSTI